MSKITYGLTCDFCDQYFTAEREHARFCSDAHRVAWHRARAQRMNSSVELADTRRIRPGQIARALVDADRAARSARSTQPKPRSRPRAQSVGRGDYAEMLRVLGMDDPQRSEDLLAAVHSRQRVDQEETRRKVDGLASGLRKANRTELLAVGDWRQNPTPARLAEAGSACAMSRSSRPSSRMPACTTRRRSTRRRGGPAGEH